MAWRRSSDKPLFEPMIVNLLTHWLGLEVWKIRMVSAWAIIGIFTNAKALTPMCVESVVSWSYSALTRHFFSEILITAMLLRIASCLANWNHWVMTNLMCLSFSQLKLNKHDDAIKWKHFPCNWPFVRGIHRSRWIPHTKASDAELWCFFDLRLNKRMSKHPRGWWFETPSWSLWRHCNVHCYHPQKRYQRVLLKIMGLAIGSVSASTIKVGWPTFFFNHHTMVFFIYIFIVISVSFIWHIFYLHLLVSTQMSWCKKWQLQCISNGVTFSFSN